jgi:hypothetical protein
VSEETAGWLISGYRLLLAQAKAQILLTLFDELNIGSLLTLFGKPTGQNLVSIIQGLVRLLCLNLELRQYPGSEILIK